MADVDWTLHIEAEPNAEVLNRILEPLSAYNKMSVGPGNWEKWAVTVRDRENAIVGGSWGEIGYDFLKVELLALGRARNRSLGRRLMTLAEEAAVERGLRGIWLDTSTFQAPNFYRKLGFEECGRISDYPPGHDRIFFVKYLRAADRDRE